MKRGKMRIRPGHFTIQAIEAWERREKMENKSGNVCFQKERVRGYTQTMEMHLYQGTPPWNLKMPGPREVPQKENSSHGIRNQTSSTLLGSILQARNQWGKYVKTGKKKISHLLTLGQVWSIVKMFLEMWDLTNLPPMHPISKATRG